MIIWGKEIIKCITNEFDMVAVDGKCRGKCQFYIV